MTKRLVIELAGDIITQPLGRIGRAFDGLEVTVRHRDIDQHSQILIEESTADVLILHAGLAHFFRDGSMDRAIEQMAHYCDLLAKAAARGATLIVVNNLLAVPGLRFVGMDGLKHADGIATLNRMLTECAGSHPMISVADLAGVVSRTGTDRAISVQNDLVMRMPYTQHVLPAIVAEYARIVRERFVPRKKVVVLDADNTLWGGVIGEDGVDGIEIGSDYPGIVYQHFQQQLRALRDSGILLAMVSKNNHADVAELFDKRTMPLTLSDFAATRINWERKSQNIASIARELNVGLDSMVFIDDNPFELEEVGRSLPGVSTHRFDGGKAADALSLLGTVGDLGCWSLTAEDRAKSQQYEQETQRQSIAQSAETIDDYIRSLDIRIEVGLNRAAQVKRIAQLTNKTNQFNLTTRRYGEAEVLALMKTAHVYDFRVIDRFGDMGIVGVVIVVAGAIDTFLMSCRAIGRRIEQEMLRHVCEHEEGAVRGAYIPKAKNGMVADFYTDNGFISADETDGVRYFDYAGGPHLPEPLTMTKVD